MKNVVGLALLVGAILTMGSDFAEKEAQRPAKETAEPSVSTRMLWDRPASALDLSLRDLSADDSRYDSIMLAQAAAPAAAGPHISVAATEGGAQVGVSHSFSTWSDITAVFRPSRWKNPFREGGSLSWLNYKAWANAPGRTGKVLLGEAIVAGATYAIIEATKSDGGSDDDGGTTPPPSTSSSSRGSSSGNSSSGDSSSGDSSSGDSSSGDSSSGDSSSGDSSSSGELPISDGERPF